MAYEKKNKKNQPIRVIAFLAIILPLALTILASTLGRSNFNLPHKLTLELLGTVQGVFSSTVNFGKDFWDHYLDLVGTSKENEKLRREVQELRAQNLEYREAAANNLSLQKLLDLERSFDQQTVTAQIVGKDPSLWFKTVTINKGSSSGIEKGMAVISDEGVVGQVRNSSPTNSQVLLAIDPNSAIDALVQENRVQGIVKGKGHFYHLHYVLKNNEVKKGDTVISSGMGGIFPKGLAIGTVSNVINSPRGMFQKIEVQPNVDFRKLEYVTIVLNKGPVKD